MPRTFRLRLRVPTVHMFTSFFTSKFPLLAPNTDLLHKYGVDLYIGAHEHSYERGYAIYRGQVVSMDYVNPGAPAYVVAGAAGVRLATATHTPDQSMLHTTLTFTSSFLF